MCPSPFRWEHSTLASGGVGSSALLGGKSLVAHRVGLEPGDVSPGQREDGQPQADDEHDKHGRVEF